MNIYILDKSLNVVLPVGQQFKSFLWSEGYNTMQSFTLELVAKDEYKKLIKPDFYVWREDRLTIGIIKSIEVKGTSMVLTGKQAIRELEDVAFVGTAETDGKATTAIRYAYNETSHYPKFSISVGSARDVYDHQISNKSMLDLITIICKECDIGYKCTFSGAGSKINIGFYKPSQDPNLVFSELIGNLNDVGVSFSRETYKNYAIVLGEGEGENRKRAVVDKTNGGDRFELLIDARDLQMNEGETEAEYMARLEARGTEELLSYQETLNCAFSVLAVDFGSKYDVGDIVTMNLPDYELQLVARVTSFTEKAQNNVSKITIEVGNVAMRRL